MSTRWSVLGSICSMKYMLWYWERAWKRDEGISLESIYYEERALCTWQRLWPLELLTEPKNSAFYNLNLLSHCKHYVSIVKQVIELNGAGMFWYFVWSHFRWYWCIFFTSLAAESLFFPLAMKLSSNFLFLCKYVVYSWKLHFSNFQFVLFVDVASLCRATL